MDKLNSVQVNEVREAEANYNKGTQAELAKNYDAAFRLYIRSAEAYLHLGRSVPGAGEALKNKWKSAANRALERAEKIKAVTDRQRASGGGSGFSAGPAAADSHPAVPPGGAIRLTPVVVNLFSPHEQFLVLKKGERVNGRVYPVWDEPIIQPVPPSLGVDNYHAVDEQPPLSSEQLSQNPEWRRPLNSIVVSPRQLLPQDILQNVVTDCSFCASIAVCLEYGRSRFKNRLTCALNIPPQLTVVDGTTCECCSMGLGDVYVYTLGSSSFLIKVQTHTLENKIVIDDRLPYNPSTNALLCMSVIPPDGGTTADNRQVIWPSLLEKAYMKLMGGYEFPGSISSSDLHTLAGWIPEHINMKSPNFEREKTWNRMLRGFLSGQCMVTVGTASKEHFFWRERKLMSEHCYPVVDVTEDSDSPMITILDSWVHGRDEGHLSQSRHLKMPWPDVISTFDGVYLSWNPDLLPKNLKFHGMWNRRGQDDQSSINRLRLIFNSLKPDGCIWVLLTRHVVDTKRTSDFISLRAELEDEISTVTNSTVRQSLTEKGTFTNSIHVLAKVQPSASSGALCITASYDGDSSEVCYTVDVYACQGAGLSWDENVSPPPYNEKVAGTFTARNSGGNGSYPTFMLNPQYHLRIHPPRTGSRLVSLPNLSRQKVKATIVLKSERGIPVNLSLAWSQGRERVYVLSQKDLAATSGPYSHGLATVFQELQPGDYSLIISAFEPRHLGSFSLSVSASAPFDLRPIPQEGAGMYQKAIKGEWAGNTAGGSPSFDKYASNPIYLIDSPSQSQIKLRLQLVEPSATTSLNVTLYPALASVSSAATDQHFKQKHIATSGPYDDAMCGVATPQTSLSAGKYWAIPSTYLPGVKAEFSLVVYSSSGDVMVERVK